jgi:hypothetical protein
LVYRSSSLVILLSPQVGVESGRSHDTGDPLRDGLPPDCFPCLFKSGDDPGEKSCGERHPATGRLKAAPAVTVAHADIYTPPRAVAQYVDAQDFAAVLRNEGD